VLPEIFIRAHNSLSLASIMSQMNPLQTLTPRPNSFNCSVLSGFPTKILGNLRCFYWHTDGKFCRNGCTCMSYYKTEWCSTCTLNLTFRNV